MSSQLDYHQDIHVSTQHTIVPCIHRIPYGAKFSRAVIFANFVNLDVIAKISSAKISYPRVGGRDLTYVRAAGRVRVRQL